MIRLWPAAVLDVARTLTPWARVRCSRCGRTGFRNNYASRWAWCRACGHRVTPS